MSASLSIIDGGALDDDPVALILRACRAGVPNKLIDQRLRRRFPKITVVEMVAAYREAGRRLAAEAEALERRGGR